MAQLHELIGPATVWRAVALTVMTSIITSSGGLQSDSCVGLYCCLLVFGCHAVVGCCCIFACIVLFNYGPHCWVIFYQFRCEPFGSKLLKLLLLDGGSHRGPWVKAESHMRSLTDRQYWTVITTNSTFVSCICDTHNGMLKTQAWPMATSLSGVEVSGLLEET